MSRAYAPELRKFLDRRLILRVNSSRRVDGTLRGYDPFMNLVIEEAYEITKDGERKYMGMVVIRGNSIQLVEVLDRNA